MSADTNAASGASSAARGLHGVFVAALVLAVPLFFLFTAPAAPALPWAGLGGGYVYFVGPPLDFDRPHDGQVVAHIDVLGKTPPDIARIRVSELATGVTVWDVTPATARAECWNGCWNVTLKAGANPASFAAGHQVFNASVPRGSSFSLRPGTAYLFEVWDSRGRVAHDRFTL